jgi:hypothetical protein
MACLGESPEPHLALRAEQEAAGTSSALVRATTAPSSGRNVGFGGTFRATIGAHVSNRDSRLLAYGRIVGLKVSPKRVSEPQNALPSSSAPR